MSTNDRVPVPKAVPESNKRYRPDDGETMCPPSDGYTFDLFQGLGDADDYGK